MSDVTRLGLSFMSWVYAFLSKVREALISSFMTMDPRSVLCRCLMPWLLRILRVSGLTL